MNSRSRYHDHTSGYATSPPNQEELETGEPIPGEEEIQVVKPLPRARIVQDGRRDEQEDRSDRGDQTDQTRSDGSGNGRMVLSSAKYLKKNRDPEIERANRKRQEAEAEMRNGGKSDGPLAFEGGVINSGVAGGTLAMIIAFLWFFVGLVFLDVFFIYPPILFVLGLIAFFRGLAKGK